MTTPTRCAICPAKYRCVPGDGPDPADGPIRIMTIGEAPGRDEDEGGRPFIGQAGREFNHNYLLLAGLHRNEIYVTNTVKCRPDLNRKPGEREVRGCSAHHLPGELDSIDPEIVVLMGATACSLVPGIDLEADHGIPRLGTIFGWTGWIVPMYHPASGLHDSAMMIPMLEDWERLEPWLRKGTWMWPVDELESKRDYGLIETKVEAEEFMHRTLDLPEPWLIGGDTESHYHNPYSWQLSFEPGVARMMMLKNHAVCKLMADFLRASFGFGDASLVFHNAPADLRIFERLLGVDLDGLYRDTMHEAYHFNNLRQGLKSLAKRLLGRTRLSWEETVTPWSKEVLGLWLSAGFIYAESNWRETVVTTETNRVSAKTGKPLKDLVKTKLVRSVPEKLLVELNGYMLNNPEYKIWDKLVERMPVEDMDRLAAVIGEPPQRGIAHCPIDVQVEYGCSDPDDTRQLAVLFETMRVEFLEKLNLQDEDRDTVKELGTMQESESVCR